MRSCCRCQLAGKPNRSMVLYITSAIEGKILPNYVRQEFDDYLKCGRLEHDFLRMRCETCERRASMTWAQRLKRVFAIDIETCGECGGAVKIIACIEDTVVIEKILTHLQEKAISVPTGLLPEGRAPPTGLFG